MDDRYKIEKSLGSGGMGEVFLAYDREAKRHIALKRIRKDLASKDIVKKRFLREAKIASILSHPSIIPIYDIHLKDSYYYTMPYVEGDTLKEIIKKTKLDPTHKLGSSIPTLIRIFLNICEAIGYIHSRNILHRDLKPDNIIIGKYGQVLILDWGIAKFLNDKEIDEDIEIKKEDLELTQIGKVAGTVSYMAPERAKGQRASIQCDIYSLGALLYYMLTLEAPFKRKDLKTFRKNMNLEKILNPMERAPHRDIPKKLADICMKCIAKDKKNRYQRVEDLIVDIENYIEGRPEWILTANLDIKNIEDWQFQENILLAEHVAISKNTDFAQWINLMVSKLAFSTNIKIEADISLDKWSNGLGFFLNILKDQNNFRVEESYKVWFNLESKDTEISRSNVLIFQDKLKIKPNTSHHLVIEKVDDTLNLYLDKKLIISHMNHLPLRGSFFAIAYKDTNFSIKNLKVFTSSYNVMVNCLAIADAFFAKEDYDTAIKEYQKIAFSFPGRKEALEATFRAGISTLEKAKKTKSIKTKQKLIDDSLEEFEKLHSTQSEPLEYLGKSLVYLEKQDFEEEAKCLELMIRKFSKHHQSPIVKEYIIYRMHQSAFQNREAAFRIILIALRFIPNIIDNVDSKKLINRLDEHLEKLYFIEDSENITHQFSLKFAFFLNKISSILEMLSDLYFDDVNIENAIFALLELDQIKEAEIALETYKEKLKKSSFNLLKLAFDVPYETALKKLLSNIDKKPSVKELRILIFLLEKLIDAKKTSSVIESFEKIKKLNIDKAYQNLLDSLLVRSYLFQNKIKLASKIFNKTLIEKISQENNPLHFLYGLWLYKNAGSSIAKSFFSGLLDVANPSSIAISTHFISSKNKDFLNRSFYFEKRRLLKDLLLYSLILKNKNILKQAQKIITH